jgi:type II secretory pathway predicted ATPase ExeA
VPRDGTERALAQLAGLVRAGCTSGLTAPPGLGKTLLLHVLADRLGPTFCCPYLPYAAMVLADLCAWTLGMMGESPGSNPEAKLAAEARRLGERGRTLLLTIDDAGSMPVETARGLGALIRDSGSRIRVVVTAVDDAAASGILVALHPDLAEVRLTQPMTPGETWLYVHSRLEQAGTESDIRQRFDEQTIERIHALSGGVPRLVHDFATSLLAERPDGVGRDWKEERWLGAPLDDTEVPALEDLQATSLAADCAGAQAGQPSPTRIDRSAGEG